MAAMAHGTTVIKNLLDSDDIRHMLVALQQLGVKLQLSADKTECVVHGIGGAFDVGDGSVELYLGNAGTAMRPLCAVLAASKGQFLLTGEPRMEERPIGALIDALAQVGADIKYQKQAHYPPLKITGNALAGGTIHIDGSISSQFLTAVLMTAPLMSADVEIVVAGELVSKPYIDITLRTMAAFGVTVNNTDYRTFTIEKDQVYRSPQQFLVEGDASSASYFLAAGAIKGGTVTVTGIGGNSIQGDIKFIEVLRAMGARVVITEDYLQVTGDKLTSIDMDLNHIPDAAMTIATTALFAEGVTTIRNIYNWRVKETDRLAAMATELRKLGAGVEEGDDYIAITPPTTIELAEIDTYNDHRMAMCFSLVALGNTAVIINDPACTSKTFPNYFQTFAAICE